MNFAPDTFESIHRRKKLAAWLATLKGPPKPDMRGVFINNALRMGNYYGPYSYGSSISWEAQFQQILGLRP